MKDNMHAFARRPSARRRRYLLFDPDLPVPAKMGYVLLLAKGEIIDDQNLIVRLDEPIHEMTSNKSGSTRYHYPFPINFISFSST